MPLFEPTKSDPSLIESPLNNDDTTSKLFAALIKAAGEMPSPILDSINPHFKSPYASLESVLKTIKPVLSRNSLGFVQVPIGTSEKGEVLLETYLFHVSGECMRWIFGMKPTGTTPQAVGSVLTFLKRYVLCAIFGISGEKDDDANEASKTIQTETMALWKRIEDVAAEKSIHKDEVTAIVKRHFFKEFKDLNINELKSLAETIARG